MKKKNNAGFTLLELLIVAFFIFVVVVGFGFVGGVLMGNFWFSENTLLKAGQRYDPNIVSVSEWNRNIWAYSTADFQDNEGNTTTYSINTNVTWDCFVVKN